MEEKYIQKRIKKELLKKDFNEWNKESIQLLISVYKYDKYKKFYESNLLLLDNFIKWYKKNKIVDMFSLDKLIQLSCIIKEDLLYEKNYDYNFVLYNTVKSFDNDTTELFFKYISYFIYNDTFYSLGTGLFFVIIYSLIKYFSKKEKEEKKLDFQIPIPENIMNNPLIKQFLTQNFLI